MYRAELPQRVDAKCLSRRFFLELAAMGLLLSGPVFAQEKTGNSTIVIHQLAENASYGGQQIRYLFGRIESPTSPTPTGGSSLYYVPPVNFPRQAGRPVIAISDPVRSCEGLWVTTDGGPTHCRTAQELAQQVWEGKVDPKTWVDVSFELELNDSLEVKRAVRDACLTQLKKVEERGGSADNSWSSGDMQKALQSIHFIPARELVLTCESPGLADVAIRLGNYPNLGQRLPLEARVPALFVSRLCLTKGMVMRLEFVFDAYGETNSSASAEQTIDSFIDLLLEGHGRGGLHYRAHGQEGDIQILTTRQTLNRVAEMLKGRQNVLVRGSAVEDINLLLGLLQRNDADLLAVTSNQVEDFLKKAFNAQKLLTEPGVATALEKLDRKESLSDEECERLYSSLVSHSSRSQGGGGLSFGPISIGGGGGGETSDTAAWKEQRRDATRKFLSDLNTYRKTGRFPVQPTLDYRICSTQKLQKRVAQHFHMQRAGTVNAYVLTSRFSTARDTLQPAAAANTFFRWRAAQEAANQKLAEIRGDPPPPK